MACIVAGCSSRWGRKTPGMSLHRVPARPAQREAWLQAILNFHGQEVSPESLKPGYVCGRHFCEEDYLPGGIKRFLDTKAVPTKFDKEPEPPHCEICNETKHLIDTWTEEFGHLHDKLQDVTNSEHKHSNWLRYMCRKCKDKLYDIWEFKILCKNAYRKFLDEIVDDSGSFDFDSYIVKEDVYMEQTNIIEKEDGWDVDMNVVETVKVENENKIFDVFDMVNVPEENLIENTPREEKVQHVAKPKIIILRKVKRPKLKSKISKVKTHDQESNKEEVKKESDATIETLNMTDNNQKTIAEVTTVKIDRPLKKFRPPRKKNIKKPVQCALCNKISSSRANLQIHMDIIHLKKYKFLCSVCGQKCATRYRFDEHQKTHLDVKPQFPCDKCERSYTNIGNLRRHIGEAHQIPAKKQPPTKPRCRFCRKYFPTKDDYYEHMKSHPGSQVRRRVGYPRSDKKCRYCSKTFTTKQSTEIHERTHTGVRPFVCEICSKTFRQEVHLKTHMYIHSGKKAFKCNYCGKGFTQPGNRNVHIRIHTGETPYGCSTCSKRFYDSKMCKKHVVKCSKASKDECTKNGDATDATKENS